MLLSCGIFLLLCIKLILTCDIFVCSLQAALYVIFLMFLTYSLLHASTKTDPTQYSGVEDALRGFCEVVTLLMAAFYVCEELSQIRM